MNNKYFVIDIILRSGGSLLFSLLYLFNFNQIQKFTHVVKGALRYSLRSLFSCFLCDSWEILRNFSCLDDDDDDNDDDTIMMMLITALDDNDDT